MSQSVREAVLLGATALALIAAPVLLNHSAMSDLSAYAKDKGGDGGGGGGGGDSGGGNGSGNGNGGDHGNGGGGEKHADDGGSDKGGSNDKGGGKSKKVATTEDVTSTTKATKTKNIKAELAGLNSLNRNINGLMNSSDKRMEQIRGYITASAELETATANLATAQETLAGLQVAFDTYVGTAAAGLTAYDDSAVYTDATLTTLTDRLAVLNDPAQTDPANVDAMAERDALAALLDDIEASPELAAIGDQQGVVDGLAAEVEELELLTSEDALRAAILTAANKNRVAAAGGDAYLTPEIMNWATAKIDGLVEDYQALQ